jgi:ferric-dicitrate binding protein FerR (iron transport regulator)
MPATSQPTDQPYGQLITDQQALERLFRALYPKLVTDAKGRLGDAAPAAPRVVSKAFHLAWQDRKRFHSQDELEAFLGAQIHHGATREISRRAGLHRMDHHEGLGGGHKEKHETHEMTVDEAWDRLLHTLQGGAPEAYRARASTARHEAAEHVAQLAKERNYKPAIAIAAVAIAAVLAGIWYIQKAGQDRSVQKALDAPNARKTETSFGQQANVTLDDGTVVRLGPETRLTVPDRFGISMRTVRVEGAALFEVTRAGDRPFEVRNGDVIVAATGTKFTVRKFADDSNLVVHVKEGTVELRRGEEIRTVGNGMSYLVTSGGRMRVPSSEELSEASTWADGIVTIVGRDLRYVVPQLKRWYGLDIKVPDTPLLDRKVFLSAALNSPKEALMSVEKSGGLKFTYVGENMVFQDTTPTARATKRR